MERAAQARIALPRPAPSESWAVTAVGPRLSWESRATPKRTQPLIL